MFILRSSLLFLGLWSSLSLEARVWTTTTGLKSAGELFEVAGNRIGLKIRGREYHFSIDRFSLSDREYIKQWALTPRCGVCSGTLGTRSKKAGKASYHVHCLKCMVCKRVVGSGESFLIDPWGGVVSAKHLSETRTCGSCSRKFVRREAKPEQFYADGRVSCGPCFSNKISKLERLKEVEVRVWNDLLEVGFEKPRNKVVLELVDQNTLIREASTIQVAPSHALTVSKYKMVSKGNQTEVSVDHRILILNGLPYEKCKLALAHEHAHVWLNERFIDASPPVIEGFCNLASLTVLQKEKSKLSSILLENMNNSTSPVYGAGYRKMRQRLDQVGWPALLAELKRKSSPP